MSWIGHPSPSCVASTSDLAAGLIIMTFDIAGRSYAPAYRLSSSRAGLHARLLAAVGRADSRLLYASEPNLAPVYLGIQTTGDERVGILAYLFTANKVVTAGRPVDEHRLQVRYGGEKSWSALEHPVGRDVAGIDITLVLGVHIDVDLFVGLDPALYDPLPMGISVEFKQADVDAALDSEHGWHVFERDNITGSRRRMPRARDGLETIVLFRPDRFLDYVRLERTASDLGLDPALRFAAASAAEAPRRARTRTVASLHGLETQFAMSSAQILEMISQRNRLTVAVRGGVAEHHLAMVLATDPNVVSVEPLDKDGLHDFDVTLTDGRVVRIECKNCSPTRYANGDMKVEVQKTRATQGDAAGRLYRPEQFDVLAACLYGPTGEWRFVYRRTDQLDRHPRYADRLAPLHHVVPQAWSSTLSGAL